MKHKGVCFELNKTGTDFEAVSYAVDDRNEFIPIEPADLVAITRNRKAILTELLAQEESTEHWIRLLIRHNPEWRQEFGSMPSGRK